MPAIDVLVKKRESLQSRIVSVQAKVVAYDPLVSSIEQMRVHYEDVRGMQSKLDKLYEETFIACDAADFPPHQVDFETLYAAQDTMRANLTAIITPAVATPAPVTVTPYKEKVELPYFDGTITKWKEFHDLFLHKVKAEGITAGSSKLAILKVKLTGEAANMISQIALTDANYDAAWANLEKRYEDKRDLVHAIILKFDEFPKLTSESGRELRTLLDLINNMVLSLTNIGVNMADSDVFIVYYSVKKLDPKTKTWWALAPKSDIAKVKELTDFLDIRSKALLETTPNPTQPQASYKPTAASPSGGHKKTHHVYSAKCTHCSGSHMIWTCPDFKALTTQARWDIAKAKHLCYNCLSIHKDRGPCPSKYTCRQEGCGKPHHTLLHEDRKPSPTGGGGNSKPHTTGRVTFKPKSSSHSRVVSEHSESVAILGTLIVDVKDSNGVNQPCRVFVDDGSEVSFVTSGCLKRLGLKSQKTYVPLTVTGNTSGRPARAKIQLTIESRSEQYALTLDALVLPEFTGLVPVTDCFSDWPHLRGLKLSDTEYFKTEYCDILLGGKKSGHILLPQVIQDHANPDAPVAWNTRFGWMVKGEAPPASNPSHQLRPRVNRVSITPSPREEISAFWDDEEVEDTQRNMSLDDMACESHFIRTHTRNDDGTYTVQLPFKRSPTELGKSREQAVARFLRTEERLEKNPVIKTEYVRIINEYLELCYLEPVPAEENKPPEASYYMPHHEVLKPSSNTTKVRVVHDASAPTSSKVSLNELLHVGPKIQTDLFPLLIRFMTHRIAMSADIWKFYPQTSLHYKDRDFHRIVWRDSPKKQLRDYRMTRVTFGVSAASFLAVRSLHQMADDTEDLSPHVVQIIKNDFLVDNLLSGATDLEAALTLQTELLAAMHIGGLKLLQWTSNSAEVIAAVPPELRDPSASLAIDEGDFLKTIGILWNPREDTFSVRVNVPPHPVKTTKRTILSTIARTFDPLNWLCPVTMRAKLLLQELWKAKLQWNEPIPALMHKKWMKYCDELPQLNEFRIERCAFAPPTTTSKNWTHQLHGFCDGSDVAHSACVYVRTVDSAGNVASRLLTAKSRINPIAKLTTPRSELCGAVLLANLVNAVQNSVNVPFTSVHSWTDSNVVLGRLSPEKKLPIYELNRIRTILQLLPAHHWHHVKGEENPADAPSRGISASALLNHPLWLHGPPWLLGHIPDPLPAVAARTAVITPTPVSNMIRNCSSYLRVKRCMARVLRFVHNAQPRKYPRSTGRISVTELESALDKIVSIIQREEFQQELEDCAKSLPLKSSLKFQTPFVDHIGILRITGRLERAEIPFRKMHPALLPKDHPFTESMVRNLHVVHLHPGPTLLMSIVREQFYVRRLRDLATKVVHTCVVCHRFRAVKSSQLMGQLPPSRVNPAPPFTHTGMDYAGPFTLAFRTGRKPPMTTAYVSLFVCMATKAIHLELASDLSSASFLAALQRFISRRGAPTDLYSDGGTNFVGAKSELAELRGLLESSSHQDAVHELLTEKGTRFHFNPPAAPHHGGLWEAGVKSMKHHLRRVIGSHHLTIEEFSTLLCRVEAILNSRPLTPMSNDPSDCSVLTPGHFLIGRPLIALPHPDLTDLNENRLDRWQKVEAMTQHLWKAWSRDYLSQLQARPKWYTPCPDLKPGTLVLIGDDTPFGPQQWKLGRITATFPGLDGKTRVCDVRTNISKKKPMGSILTRPVTKLSPLPIYS